jgi:toxin FitB
MILLDTNIISEVMAENSSQDVVAWLDAQHRQELFLSAITLLELQYGIERMSAGTRRLKLEMTVERIVCELYAGRICAVDSAVARAAGQARVRRERLGRPITVADAAIAATAITHGFSLATRNIKDFEGLDLELINPFEPHP